MAALALLRAELGPQVTLTVAGPERWPLRGEVPDGVEFLGPVPRARVGELMDSHDLFVMPSRMEGFGMVFAEALTRGLPCIGRDACAMPEIIDPVSGGRLVGSERPDELAQVIAGALADDALYAACAEQADARRAHYTWGRAARDVLDAAGQVARTTRN
ncbi:glycosyltransferase family 4 protein [Cellulomonas soli]